MNRVAHRRTKIAALATALLISAGAAGSAVASGDGAGTGPREAAALTGTAKLYRSAGDDISFTFDAHLAAEDTMDPEAATGTFSFRHVFPDGRSAWAKARVDCLVTGGRVAVVTGVVTDSDTPFKGKRVGISVHDQGRHDRLGYSWIGSEPEETKKLPKCVSAAPFEKVKAGTGDFRVLPWQPKL
ncbi:Repetin [Streptomyces sp. NPDC006368]|uniref:Repetin n=1 Tax=Streptomyces sp. NPDC006368 TaxID=3156760 RepID=UPI0033A166BC